MVVREIPVENLRPYCLVLNEHVVLLFNGGMKIGQNTALNIKKKNIRHRLNIILQAKKNEKENLDLKGEFGIEFQFHLIKIIY